jgi:carbamate kinase
MKGDVPMKRILVALGGNAIKQPEEEGTTENQLRNCEKTTRLLAEIVKDMGKDDRLVITHGNGPQAGNLMVQQEMTKDVVPSHPLDVVGAMTQGQIGYMLQQTLENQLIGLNIRIPVCSIVTQVLVDKDDPEFLGENASKPIGEFFTEEEAKKLKRRHPEYIIKKVKPNGERAWRRVVPSPDPIGIVESEAIRKIVDSGIIVIASGGGGIPVIYENGRYRGIEAVIDKDLAGEKLAEIVGANIFLLLTDIEKVKLNFGKPNERDIDEMTLEQAKKYMEEGHFLPGSMGPKIKACIRFLEWGGEKAIVASLGDAVKALNFEAGTTIYKDVASLS